MHCKFLRASLKVEVTSQLPSFCYCQWYFFGCSIYVVSLLQASLYYIRIFVNTSIIELCQPLSLFFSVNSIPAMFGKRYIIVSAIFISHASYNGVLRILSISFNLTFFNMFKECNYFFIPSDHADRCQMKCCLTLCIFLMVTCFVLE